MPLLLLAVAACGDDAAGPDAAAPDAPPPAIDAPAAVVTGGKLFSVVDFQLAPVADAAVELRARDGDAVLATATTAADGSFAFTVVPPADGYVAAATAGRLPTHAYPWHPLTGGENVLVVVADAAEVGRWYQEAGDRFDASARTVIAAVVDAEGGAAAGATVTVAPPPVTLTYYDPDAPAWDPALTSGPNGYALATSTAAAVTVTGSLGTPRQVAPAAGAVTMVVLGP